MQEFTEDAIVTCVGSATFSSAAALVSQHPPVLQCSRKAALFELGLQILDDKPLTYSRWRLLKQPCLANPAGTQLVTVPGPYNYQAGQGAWWVNFADTQLFGYYGTPLFAQDEVQVAEHPVLASVREAAQASPEPELQPLTIEGDHSTPFLVQGAQRCLVIDTGSLYGNAFQQASVSKVVDCARQIQPPAFSNILAMAAPRGWNAYTKWDITEILDTAIAGFSAARSQSAGRCVVCTGHWGCGAFGGNQTLMAMLQLVAARMAGVHELRYYAFDAAGASVAARAAQRLQPLWHEGLSLPAFVQRVADLSFRWGVSNNT